MTTIKQKAYILRTCDNDMTSYGGFVWPESGRVEATDWKPTKQCGNGLHGALWGEGDGWLFNWSLDAKWLVVEIDEYSDLGGKVKFPSGTVVFCGDRIGATSKIVELGARGAVIGGTATAGDHGTATAGYHGTATAGYHGTATAGRHGTATAGYHGTATAGVGGTATAGDGGTATAGYHGTATAGRHGTATVGYHGTATAGVGGTATAGDGGTATAGYRGILQIKHYDGKRYRIRTAYVGEGGIKPDTAYRLNQRGEFTEVKG